MLSIHGLLLLLVVLILMLLLLALYDLQRRVGLCFAQAQGGVYADPLLASVVAFIRASLNRPDGCRTILRK